MPDLPAALESLQSAHRGDDPDAAYRIARTLRHHYQHIRLAIPSRCKSAGTLIAIGAHELAIGDLGELGPIDVQVLKPTEIEERCSGLDILQAVDAAGAHVHAVFLKTLLELRRSGRLSTRAAGLLATKIAMGVANPLYSQIDPNRLGELHRTMRIATEYGERLNRTSDALRAGWQKSPQFALPCGIYWKRNQDSCPYSLPHWEKYHEQRTEAPAHGENARKQATRRRHV